MTMSGSNISAEMLGTVLPQTLETTANSTFDRNISSAKDTFSDVCKYCFFEIDGTIANFSVYDNGTFSTASPEDLYPAGLPSGYTWSHIIITSIYVTVIIIAIVFGNALVCVAIATDRNLKSTQNWFIASLAVADLLLGMLIVPFSLANELMGYWYFGTIWCELWKAIDVLLCTASINSLCLISLDRYWSITRAIHYARQRTPKRAAIMITTVWIISAVVCVPPLIGWKQPPRESDYPVCELSEDIGYVLYSSMGSFYIPMVIILFVYMRVYLAARERARRTVKKQKIPKAENGKSPPTTTTTTTTTTSFTTLPKNNNETVEHEEVATIPEAEGSSALSDGDESGFTTYNPKSGAFEGCGNGTSTTGTGVQSGDETKNLLSNDTDSVDTSNRGYIVTSDSESADMRHIGGFKLVPLVPDTDSSTVDSPGMRRKDRRHVLLSDSENSKPLLEESDSAPTHESTLHNFNKDCPSVDPDGSLPSGTGARIKPGEKEVTVTSKYQILSMPKGFGNFLHKSPNRQKAKPKKEQVFRTAAQRDHERQKRKLAKARERRATIVVGIVMAAFILCWLPFFTLYVSSALCNGPCIPMFVFKFFFWLGYCNSALNPFIYTIFNREFRHAFQKIIFRRSRC
ncbi:alpha-2C adrenergic receptor-like [Liolophura sinensis]|uniref:alpha-2C adrenergic receptor-like n=1 Tax=Liolophura sinensis TaxID=3198878 RepID=UPI003158E6F5